MNVFNAINGDSYLIYPREEKAQHGQGDVRRRSRRAPGSVLIESGEEEAVLNVCFG